MAEWVVELSLPELLTPVSSPFTMFPANWLPMLPPVLMPTLWC